MARVVGRGWAVFTVPLPCRAPRALPHLRSRAAPRRAGTENFEREQNHTVASRITVTATDPAFPRSNRRDRTVRSLISARQCILTELFGQIEEDTKRRKT
jgi:hypothetical protein